MQKVKASDYVAAFLDAQGVRCVFEMSGGMITHMLDSLNQAGRVRVVSMHHEQGAAFAAEGFGRMTGTPGVAMATSGPGATNLLTGIGSCYFDSTPAVFITGQVNRHEQKGDRLVRQLGFQETDIVTMAKPITKAAWMVNSAEELPEALRRAFALALDGRPGPVLLDVPMDVQRDRTGGELPAAPAHAPVEGAEDEEFYDDLFAHLARAERPLILVGGGVRSGRATALCRKFISRLGVPAVHSLMAVDALAYDDPMRVGMIGSYGNRWANLALGASDFLLVLGSRLDVRQTGADPKSFKGKRSIFQVDCDLSEMNNRVIGCRTHHRQLTAFLAQALTHPRVGHAAAPAAWRDEINRLRAEWPDTGELKGVPGINPNAFLHAVSGIPGARPAAAWVADVGQHQMWAAQSLELYGDQRFLTSGGMGSMGFALPAAVGACLADGGKRPVAVVAGDGGFQSNIQEMQTVVRNQLPLKLIIINNHCHGMVRQFQESYFDSRYQSTLWGYSAPDFEAVARAYGMEARTVADPAGVDEAAGWLWADPSQPALLQVMVDTSANAYPKLAFGHSITDMEPFVKPIDMEGT
jgi:acetolactate synthase-1/2/3 large subunit